jgi:hypothetical protein
MIPHKIESVGRFVSIHDHVEFKLLFYVYALKVWSEFRKLESIGTNYLKDNISTRQIIESSSWFKLGTVIAKRLSCWATTVNFLCLSTFIKKKTQKLTRFCDTLHYNENDKLSFDDNDFSWTITIIFWEYKWWYDFVFTVLRTTF